MKLSAHTVYTEIQNNKNIAILVNGKEHLVMKQFVSQNHLLISTRLREVTAK
jgi:hypothetical protein